MMPSLLMPNIVHECGMETRGSQLDSYHDKISWNNVRNGEKLHRWAAFSPRTDSISKE